MRVFLRGRAIPRSEIALIGIGGDTSSVTVARLLENGEVFIPEDYISLGYTNFEVWCIGAAGGRGGGYIYRPDGYPADSRVLGGAGGGGGLHRVGGLLADLPNEVEVIVGQPGLPGENESGHQPYFVNVDGDGRISMPVTFYQNPDWTPATPGSDGGFSSFNGDTARASGGKGGAPVGISAPYALYYPSGELNFISTGRRLAGDGGDGGKGGVALSGGGAEGGSIEIVIGPQYQIWPTYISPKNGTWDGSVGEGGGGGIGGTMRWTAESQLGAGDSVLVPPSVPEALAMRGGKGSFSYADTSVYGPGQPENYERDPVSAWYQFIDTLTGGTGGGAKANKTLPFGSRALGFSPNGVVYIRIFKLA